MSTLSTLEAVRHYYSRVLQSTADLKTSACCVAESLPVHLSPYLANIHEEVRSRFYGCGLVVPPLLQGLRILDLGCGTGRDVYLLSQLVGEHGHVIGVDMTEEQLAVARRHEDFHRKNFGYQRSNVSFLHGYIEDLGALGIADSSIDLVISNCVINLSPAKDRVLSEVMRVLKPGGEFYFSDVYADRRLPVALQQDPVLLGECLGGALYVQDFRRIMKKLGVEDFRKISQSPIELHDPDVRQKVGLTQFASITYRIFKINLEDQCEDYGQIAIYRGSIRENPHSFVLDDHHIFETGRPMLVCRNTADMLKQSRFGEHFTVMGDANTHFGLFPCGPAPSSQSAAKVASCAPGGACC